MRLNQLKNIHSWVRGTSVSEILFVSALILPAYLLMYNYAIEQINEEWKTFVLLIALLIYVAGIAWMKLSQSSNEKDAKDLLVIKNYILDKGFSFMSFEKLAEIDKSFTAERVKELIFVFPNEIRLAKLKDNKKGIKVLNVEDENT